MHKLYCLMMMASLITLSAFAEDAFTVSEFSFSTPAGWVSEKPQSRMRAAQLKVPGKDEAAAAEVTFFYFGARGGTVDANKRRWLGQFEDRRNDKEESKTVNDHKITYIATEGTFMSGPPFGQKTAMPNSGLLGAILEGKQGSVFIKMTGPSATVQAATEAFKAMVEAAAGKDK